VCCRTDGAALCGHCDCCAGRNPGTTLQSIPGIHPLEKIMNKDQVKGRVKKAKGKVKKVAGKLVGSKGMEEQGKADETAGAVQAAYGDVKNNKQKKGHQPQL